LAKEKPESEKRGTHQNCRNISSGFLIVPPLRQVVPKYQDGGSVFHKVCLGEKNPPPVGGGEKSEVKKKILIDE